MGLSPDQMGAAIIANLPKKTGRTLAEWVVLARAEAGSSHDERLAWLKAHHALGQIQACVVACEAREDAPPPASPEQLLAAQYSGPKAALRPIYERVAAAVLALGPGARPEPRGSYVSLVRAQQFGIVQATTRTRVDLGLRLRGVAPTARFVAAGHFGSGQVTHRVALTRPADVDSEVEAWLSRAYEASPASARRPARAHRSPAPRRGGATTPDRDRG